MLYFKILNGSTIITAEAHDAPVYIRRQPKNNILVRCEEPHAQGILSLDGESIYQLQGRTSIGIPDAYTAVPTYMTEYEEIINAQSSSDIEDTEPEIPDGVEEETVLTRAELTARIKALEEELQAAKILLGVE